MKMRTPKTTTVISNGYTSSACNRRTLAAATRAVVEQVESRCLLTALVINGTDNADAIFLDSTSYFINNVPVLVPANITSITINGGGSGDTITVTSGFTIATTINGGAGNDTIVGSGNTRDINGGDDDDVITVSRTVEFGFGNVNGDGGNDRLIGTSAGEALNGGEGNDTLQGNNANTGIFGNDSLSGGTGDDTYVFGNLPTTRDFSISENSGGGTDTLDFSAVTTSLNIGLNNSSIVNYPGGLVRQFDNNIENIIGGSGDDTIIGNNGTNTLIGGGGNDLIEGRDSNDRLEGGIGNDTLLGGEGNDRAIGNAGNDTYTFSTAFTNQTDTLINFDDETGIDTIDFSGRNNSSDTTAAVTIDLNAEIVATHAFRTVINILNDIPSRLENAIGGSGNDLIIGSDGPNVLSGSGGDDDLRSGFGNDTLNGDSGSDILEGGFDNDTYVFELTTSPETDFLIENPAGGTDALDFSALPASDPVGADLGSDFLVSHINRQVRTLTAGQFVNFENLIGGAGDDFIAGNAGNNVLEGGAGNDLIAGGVGNNVLTGGQGNDTLDGTSGNDTYRFGTLTSGFDNDVVFEASNNGTDTLDFSGLASTDPVIVSLNIDLLATHTNRAVRTFFNGQFANIENAIGGAGNDTLTGNTSPNSLVGNAGNDILVGGPGVDSLDGGTGTNQLFQDAQTTPAPEVEVQGNSIVISDNDTTPLMTDFTDFGSTAVGTTVSRTFTVRNTGNAPLTTSNLRVLQFDSPTGAASSLFAITEPLSATIAPGASDTFTLRYTPTAAGSLTRYIYFTTNDSNENPTNFAVRGNATAVTGAPEVEVQGNNVVITDNDTTPITTDFTDFGSIGVGNTVSRTFTVRNTGIAPLTTSNLRVLLTDSPMGAVSTLFAITEGLSATIAPGASDTFTLRYIQPSSGSFTRFVYFTTNDSNENPTNFAVRGTIATTASAPEIELLGNNVVINDNDTTPNATDFTDFGTKTPAGAAITRTFTIRNIGNAALILSNLKFTQLDGTSVTSLFSLVGSFPSSIAGGASATFTVRFSGTTIGAFDRLLSFTNNDLSEGAYNFVLRGRVA
jgi:Ca2+-binding RTX toxin-like protein